MNYPLLIVSIAVATITLIVLQAMVITFSSVL